MKKLLLALCVGISVFLSGCSEVKVIDYNDSHKDAVMEVVFQDPYKFFCGSDAVAKGFISEEFFMAENKKGMEAILNNPVQVKKVLTCNGKAIGFVEFYKSRDLSLESLKMMTEAQGLPFDENQMLAAMPYLKKTNAECEEFALIECMAVSREFRGKGYGRKLIKVAVDEIKKLWPTIKQVRLDFNATNDVAKKLYESEGFVASPIQPIHLSIMNVIQYEKSLS